MISAAERERLETTLARANELLRRRGGAHLQIRAIWDEGSAKVWIRTDLVEDDGTRHKRQESPELSPSEGVRFVEKIMAALGKS